MRQPPDECRSATEVARGQGNKETARALGIAEMTVKIHVQHILRKLKVSSRVHASMRCGAGPGKARKSVSVNVLMRKGLATAAAGAVGGVPPGGAVLTPSCPCAASCP